MNEDKKTPLMQQYEDIRKDYPDMLLFFQVGDFYELFFEDAKKAAAFLGIALTKRGTHNGEPIPLCGVPVHALDHYLQKLVKGGFCVAICDQLEVPKPGTVVKRGVTQVLTPGTLTDSKLLDEHSASYLLSFFPQKDKWGVVFAELLTSQLYATTLPAGAEKILDSELHRFFPDEVVLNKEAHKNFGAFFKKRGYFMSAVDEENSSLEWAQKKFSDAIFARLQAERSLYTAVQTLHTYLQKTNGNALEGFNTIHFYEPEDFLMLDAATQRNLELVKNNQDGGRANTLLQLLDKSITSMGSRTLKKWLVRPLMNKTMINHRLHAVSFLKERYVFLQEFQRLLSHIGDAERVVGRISLGRAHIHDYIHISRVLEYLPLLKDLLCSAESTLLQLLGNSIIDFSSLYALLKASLNYDSSYDWVIKKGFNKQLDELRYLVSNTQSALLALEQKEQQETGIQSLKIRYNAIHGYYVEITNSNLHLVPQHYVRRQTLVGKERFIFAELQELQHQIVIAGSQIEALEKELFEHIKQQVLPYISDLRKSIHAISQLDALLSFAQCAYERGYTFPEIHDSRDIIIHDGKHPVVERAMGSGFVPNDTVLNDEQSLWILTGPNMGGKSTYLRQVALLSIMAQCGSFVPAQKATLPLLDRIFTRIGASDNVAEGKSTFLVEMEETAHICQYATQNSLVILDEVGRGTSTFDGLALAQAVVEYIYSNIKARCLFATHYHELTALEEAFPGIVSYHAASTQSEKGIVFLHKIIRGAANGSFGLEVAKLALLPVEVIKRAQCILAGLGMHSQGDSLGSFDYEKETLKEEVKLLRKKLSQFDSLNYEELSPKAAFDLLWKLRETQN